MIRIGYSAGGMQGADLSAFCADLAGIEMVRADTQERLEMLAAECDALMINSARYTRGLAEALTDPASPVRWLQFASVGYETAQAIGVPGHITVTNGHGVWGATVAEHAVAMILSLMRGLPVAERERAAARWDAEQVLPALWSLERAEVAIVGFGDIGQGIAARLRPFGARLHAISRSPRANMLVDDQCPLDQAMKFLPRMDVVVLALPLAAETRHLVNAEWLAAMKPDAILVNVGRGGLIDQDALVASLREGRLGGAALDVADPEPLPSDSPLWGMQNLIITPHVAAMGGRAIDRLLELCRDNILLFQAGAPLRNRVAV